VVVVEVVEVEVVVVEEVLLNEDVVEGVMVSVEEEDIDVVLVMLEVLLTADINAACAKAAKKKKEVANENWDLILLVN
jgi:hypothetical protein